MPTQPQPVIVGPKTAPVSPAAAPESATAAPMAAAATLASYSIDMKVLLIAADGKETDYPALKAFLNQIGIPYDTLIGTQQQLTWDKLSDGASHGYYQGIVLTTGNLGYDAGGGNWQSAFDGNEWFALWDYEAKFGVRQMTSYTVPGGWPDTYGLNYVGVQDTTVTPLQTTLTAAGKTMYPYFEHRQSDHY